MEVHFYFAYGSNMNPERVQNRRMDFHSAEGGRLFDFELRFNKRSVKYPGAASANVVKSVGAVTEGVVYKLASPDQITMMDPYEGYPVRYSRYALPIEVSKKTVHAWVYTANEDHIQEGLNPTAWYLDHLLAGRSYLTPAYYESLLGVACMPGTEVEPE